MSAARQKTEACRLREKMRPALERGHGVSRKDQGKRSAVNVFSSDKLQERNQVYRGLKPSPCSTADPELMGIIVNSAAGAGEPRGSSFKAATRWQRTF